MVARCPMVVREIRPMDKPRARTFFYLSFTFRRDGGRKKNKTRHYFGILLQLGWYDRFFLDVFDSSATRSEESEKKKNDFRK